MKHRLLISLAALFLLLVLPSVVQAGFPDDFSDVIWIDPDVSAWQETAQVSVNVSGSTLAVTDSKRDVWPGRFHTVLNNNCCNRSLWIFIKFKGQWYATTFEFMRVGQINKNAEAVNGGQMKRPPFLNGQFLWQPAEGEVYGFMTSGMARFDLNNVNVRERSNVALYRWGVGPTNNVNFEEVERGPSGYPLGQEPVEPEPEPEPEPEECIEPPTPAPVNNTHTYSGRATGTLEVSGANNQTADFEEDVVLTVKDDRSITFTLDDESFSTQIAQNGGFGGVFTFDIGGAGICIVDINVAGTVNGTRAGGAASGSDSCAGNTATFEATFIADSPTAPSYLDERPPQRPSNVCGNKSITPILPLLLDD